MMAFTVFGVDLDFLLQRDAPDGEAAPGAVPSVLERLIDEVERRGLTEVGICTCLLQPARVPGARSDALWLQTVSLVLSRK